ncbi:MAG: DUF4835 family protein [Flavobacteriales bacterium]|nr:DUF4835 family protein [Flavobacteriales bacterium]
MRRSLFLVLFALTLPVVHAQEFNCTVSVIAPQIQSTPKRIWQSMETAIRELMNARRWTNRNYTQAERIDVNMLITINEQQGLDRFKGSIQLIYARPVFNTDYNSPEIDLKDEDLEFSFLENTQIDFSPDRFSNNLSHVLGFYAYFILGVDADTYSSMGGSEYYAVAQTIVNNAQNASEAGWKAFENTKNRYWLIDNQQQAVFRPLRECLYIYHREGFDLMSGKMEEAPHQYRQCHREVAHRPPGEAILLQHAGLFPGQGERTSGTVQARSRAGKDQALHHLADHRSGAHQPVPEHDEGVVSTRGAAAQSQATSHWPRA